jgi:hypothetical protein
LLLNFARRPVITGTSIPLSDGPRAKVDDVDQGVGVAGGLMQTLRARGATGNSGGFLRQVMTEGRS